jgi:MFS family permease
MRQPRGRPRPAPGAGGKTTVDYYVCRAIVLLHVLGVFAFLLTHGASAMAAFHLHKERRRERVAALLELSAFSSLGMSLALTAVLATGIALGALAQWYNAGWFWASLVGFFLISLPMTPLATLHYSKVRRSMGLKGPRLAGKRASEPLPPMSDEELDAELSKVRPWALTFVGFGGVAALAALMMFKPF